MTTLVHFEVMQTAPVRVMTEEPQMRVASRVASMKESATLAVGAKAAAMKAQGLDVISFSLGEPDFTTPAPIREAAKRALDAGLTHYAPTPGDKTAREAIAKKLRDENGIPCRAEHVTVTAGAKHAVYMALQALIEPAVDGGADPEVLLPTPAWVSYRPLIELAGGACVEIPTSIENGFRIDPGKIAAAITPRTVGIILNSPSNPCGSVISPSDYRGVLDLLAANPAITVISDEIYEKLIYPEIQPGLKHVSPGADPRLAERTITINGMSKAYAMTGWRIGYLAAPGAGGRVAREIIKLQGQMTNSIPSFFFAAIVEALTNGAAGVEEMRRTFAARGTRIFERLSAIPRVRCARPVGAFYVFPDISKCLGLMTPKGRRLESAQAFSEALLEEAMVAVVPGEDFGACARTHVRVSFASSDSDIDRGCERIAAFVASLKA